MEGLLIAHQMNILNLTLPLVLYPPILVKKLVPLRQTIFVNLSLFMKGGWGGWGGEVWVDTALFFIFFSCFPEIRKLDAE